MNDCKSSSVGNICWRHKVAYLHHSTNLWLGQLCYLSAQPRQARAYLRQALTLAEQLALPLRTAELLSLLAEVDLQCDQLEDCRVKIDSLDLLLKVHDDSGINDDLQMNILTEKHKESFPAYCKSFKSEKDFSQFSVYQDNGLVESMREANVSPEFRLKIPSVDLQNRIVIGNEKRIGQLAQPNLCPPSPSLYYREKYFVLHNNECPCSLGACLICISPEIHCIFIRLAASMAIIHTHQGNAKGAEKCLQQAKKRSVEIQEHSLHMTSKLTSILNKADHPSFRYVNLEDKEKLVLFYESKMAPAKFSMFYHENEILCISQKWSEAKVNNLNALTEVSKTSSIVLIPNHSIIVQLILQSHAISRIKSNIVQSKEDTTLVSPSAKNTSSSEEKDDLCFKTPSRSTKKCNISALRTKERVTILTTGSLVKSEKPKGTKFNIFTDDEEELSFKKAPGHVKKFEKRTGKTRITKGKSGGSLTETDDELSHVESSLSKLSVSKKTKPFAEVFQLPEREDIPKTYGRTRFTPCTKSVQPIKKNSPGSLGNSSVNKDGEKDSHSIQDALKNKVKIGPVKENPSIKQPSSQIGENKDNGGRNTRAKKTSSKENVVPITRSSRSTRTSHRL